MAQIKTLDIAIAQDPEIFSEVKDIFREGSNLPPNSVINNDAFSPKEGEEVDAAKKRQAILADAGQNGGLEQETQTIDTSSIEANSKVSVADTDIVSNDAVLKQGMKDIITQPTLTNNGTSVGGIEDIAADFASAKELIASAKELPPLEPENQTHLDRLLNSKDPTGHGRSNS